MVTCPYQSEGVLTNRIVLWAAINLPFARKWIAKLDDIRGSGLINPIKKWWFDLEDVDGVIGPARKVSVRKLNLSRKMDATKQKIAVFPPELAPPPDAHWLSLGIAVQNYVESLFFQYKSWIYYRQL